MKLLSTILVLMLLFSPALATNKLGVELTKNVNSGYTAKLLADQEITAFKIPFIPKTYFRSAVVFTAPRGNIFESVKHLNHAYYQLAIGGGLTVLGGQLELETGARHYWDGNSMGIPEETQWDNTVRYYYEF